jgi:hypothetical protein
LDLFAVDFLVAHDLEETHLRFLFILLGHLTGGDVFKVLEPLEVGASDTTTVDKKVRGTDDASLDEDLFSGEGGGAIGTLEDSFNLNLLGVLFVKGFLDGGGNQVVGLLKHVTVGVSDLSLSGTGEALKSAVFSEIILALLNVDTVGVVDGTVVFNDCGDLGTVLFEELCGPVSDSAESLNDEGAVLDTFGKFDLIAEVSVACQLTDCVVNTETSGLVTAVDTTLSNELASAAALSVDVLFTLNVHVGIFNPGHDLFVGSHVGSETVDSGTDETLLDELHGVTTGYSLELTLGKLTGVDLDATLATTEWDVSDSELEGHEGSKSLDFLEIDVLRISCATLARKLVGGVLSSTKDISFADLMFTCRQSQSRVYHRLCGEGC